jgi:ankyrin repeat protein
LIEALIREAEEKNPPSPARDLINAAFDGDIERVKELLAAGVPIGARDGSNHTALHAAVENLREEMVEFLLQNGADPNEELSQGWTPLFHAIDAEGDAASQLSYADPPDSAITRLLLRYGADPLHPGPKGENLAEFAEKTYLHHEAARLLRDATSPGTP